MVWGTRTGRGGYGGPAGGVGGYLGDRSGRILNLYALDPARLRSSVPPTTICSGAVKILHLKFPNDFAFGKNDT